MRLGPIKVSIELINADVTLGCVKHALFDFDGTLSTIRRGWQDIMIPMLTDCLDQYPANGETRADRERIVTEFVTDLTGKQTIYQMLALCDEIKRRGGEPRDALDYKHEYLERLEEHIRSRKDAVRNGNIAQDDAMLRGARDVLKAFQRAGVTLYLASGTDIGSVQEEVALLGIDDYFGSFVYGAIDDYKSWSKAKVVNDIIKTNALSGPELVVFGDGFVEIEETHNVGGLCIGVASD